MMTPMKSVTAAVLVLVIALSATLWAQLHQTSNTLSAVRAEEQSTRDRYSAAIGAIATIQDSLNAIVLGDEQARMTPAAENEHALTGSETDQVLDRIAMLRAGVERSKVRIEELDRHLRQSGMRIAGLERMIGSLKRTVARKEQMIQALAMRVDSLDTQVTGLTQTVADRTHELNTVYCVMGDRHELMRSGVVVASGGVLGLGRTLKPSARLDESMCTTVDVDAQSTIDIPAKRATVLTPQPSASYELVQDGDHTTLRILDPREFRKVRHLVIVESNA